MTTSLAMRCDDRLVTMHEMMCGSHKRHSYTQMLANDQTEKPCYVVKVQVGRK
jgi:hypothetical protein